MQQQLNPAMPTDGGLSNTDWRYVPASHTNIRERFERMRAAQVPKSIVVLPAPEVQVVLPAVDVQAVLPQSVPQ